MKHRRYFTAALLAATLAYQPTFAAEESTDAKAPQWYEIDNSDGVKIWKLDIPDAVMPGFRGEARIAASAEQILAAIKDVDSHTEWMHRCADARLLRVVDEQETILYNRTDSPWPVWDRDVVVSSRIERAADGSQISVLFRNVDAEEMPVQDDAVRMPRLEGSYTLTAISPEETQVTYTVEVDVGGSIPGWVAEMVARDLPYKTLTSLRQRTQSR